MGCCSEACSTAKDENTTRGNWDTKPEYVLSLLGLAVGLGNVWRFPYLCYVNGGGAFLIPYLVMVTLIGIPIFMLETSMAQFSSATVVNLYAFCPAMRGVSFVSLIATSFGTMYYSVLCAYPLIFIWESLTFGPLPWVHCDHSWNTPDCYDSSKFKEVANVPVYSADYGLDTLYSDLGNTTAASPVTASEEFFHYRVLQLSDRITDIGVPVTSVNVANLIVWVLIFLIIFKGVKVIGKVAWVTALFPFFMLLVLLVRGLTLPGAWYGVQAYLIPDLWKLLDLQVWTQAATQIFFSLGIGWGTLHCLSSFNRFHNNTMSDALLVPIINGITSFVAGLLVFSILGYICHNTGRSIHDVTTIGINLAFITYPEALAMMPGPHLWSVCFFLMLFFLGMGSCFVQVQTVQSSLIDYFPQLRPQKTLVTFIVCLVIYLGSLLICTQGGIYWLIVLDATAASRSVVFIGMAEIITFAYFYGPGCIIRDIQVMLNTRLKSYWWWCWILACPVILLLIFIIEVFSKGYLGYGHHMFPYGINVFSTVVSWLIISIVPVYWIVYMFMETGPLNERIRKGHSPSAEWGPSLREHREAWRGHCQRYEQSSWKGRYTMPPASVSTFSAVNKHEETLEMANNVANV